MVTPRADLCAARDRIPRCVCPLDRTFRCHDEPTGLRDCPRRFLALVYDTSKPLFLQEQKSVPAIFLYAYRVTESQVYQPERRRQHAPAQRRCAYVAGAFFTPRLRRRGFTGALSLRSPSATATGLRFGNSAISRSLPPIAAT